MMRMALRGYKGQRFYSSFSRGPLEIKGMFWASGPQPVGGEGGVPQDIADLFDSRPDLKTISLEWTAEGQTCAVVYSRMKESSS